MTNRNPVKQLFITFPHSNVDKLTFRDDLLRFEPDYYNIVEEKHKDGSPHLHAIIRFTNKYSKPFVLKYFKGKYPQDYKRIDIKPVRSIKHAIEYLSKEDKNPLISGDYTENRKPQAIPSHQFAKFLGYKDTATVLATIKEEEEIQSRFRASVLEQHEYFHRNYPDYRPTFHFQKCLETLLCNIPLSKDDITLLTKDTNIKYK